MLWRKAWLETRTRFWVCLLLVSLLCGFFVFAQPWITAQWRHDRVVHPEWLEPAWLTRALGDYPYFTWHFLYANLLQSAWALAALLLGLGGLVRESVLGTSSFTLSLPVSRRRQMAVRSALAIGELAILGLLPALLLPLFSALAGRPYPFAQGLAHSALMVAGGLVFFSLSTLLATTLRDEHTPLLVAVSAAALFYFVAQPYADGRTHPPPLLRLLNLVRLLAGPADLRGPGDVPWAGLAFSLAAALALLAASFHLTGKRDL
jgi:ABC-2 type transport system permease protein